VANPEAFTPQHEDQGRKKHSQKWKSAIKLLANVFSNNTEIFAP